MAEKIKVGRKVWATQKGQLHITVPRKSGVKAGDTVKSMEVERND